MMAQGSASEQVSHPSALTRRAGFLSRSAYLSFLTPDARKTAASFIHASVVRRLEQEGSTMSRQSSKDLCISAPLHLLLGRRASTRPSSQSVGLCRFAVVVCAWEIRASKVRPTLKGTRTILVRIREVFGIRGSLRNLKVSLRGRSNDFSPIRMLPRNDDGNSGGRAEPRSGKQRDGHRGK